MKSQVKIILLFCNIYVVIYLYKFQLCKNSSKQYNYMTKIDNDHFIDLKADNEVLKRQLDGN